MKLLSKKSLSSFSILPEIIAILLAFLISALYYYFLVIHLWLLFLLFFEEPLAVKMPGGKL